MDEKFRLRAFPHLVLAQGFMLALEHELEIRLEIHSVRLPSPICTGLFSLECFADLVVFLKREMTVVNSFGQ
ncbi:MAG: hypothetical protein ACLUSL_12545 [Ruminococcus sp.]